MDAALREAIELAREIKAIHGPDQDRIEMQLESEGFGQDVIDAATEAVIPWEYSTLFFDVVLSPR